MTTRSAWIRRLALLLGTCIVAPLAPVSSAQALAQRPARPDSARTASATQRFAVGYRLAYVFDSSRTLAPDTTGPVPSTASRANAGPRVLPLRIFYPSPLAPTRSAMRYGEYVDVRPDDGRPVPAVADSLRARTVGLLDFVAGRYSRTGRLPVVASDTVGLVSRLLATPTQVSRGAPHAPGRFPVMVFAGGAYHSVDENVGLWEQLASRGWIVAAFPSVGIDGSDLPDDDAGLETMTRDVETVIAHLGREPNVDLARVAAAGFSFGGAAALEAASRNRRIGAVVGLDPSFIARRHTDRVRRAPLFAPARVAVPLLELHRADTTVDLGVVESLTRSARWSVEFTGIDHVDFNSYSTLLQPLLVRRSGPMYAMRDSAVAAKVAAYRGMVESIIDFLGTFVARPGDRQAFEAAIAGNGSRWRAVPNGRVCVRALPIGQSTSRGSGCGGSP
jgi:dienelactone hydrolase